MFRKAFTLIFIIYCSSAIAQGVVLSNKYFDGGIIAGFDVTQIDGDFLGGYNKIGALVGGFVSREITKEWTGRMELKFIQKGKVNPADPENGDYTYLKVRLNYLQMPLVAEYFLNERFSAEGGVALAYLLTSGIYDEYGKFTGDNVPYEFYPLEVAGFIGGNYYINERWRANVRWSYSVFAVADLLDDVEGFYAWQNPGAQYNRSLEFSFCYYFGK